MDRIYTVDELGDYLEHHGILGQRWGQLNGPPLILLPILVILLPKKEVESCQAKPELQLVKVLAKGSIGNLKRTGLSSTQKKILIGVR